MDVGHWKIIRCCERISNQFTNKLEINDAWIPVHNANGANRHLGILHYQNPNLRKGVSNISPFSVGSLISRKIGTLIAIEWDQATPALFTMISSGNQFLMVSDLDDTLLGNTEALRHFRDFYQSECAEFVSLAYASGRFVDSITDDIQSTHLPQPKYINGIVVANADDQLRELAGQHRAYQSLKDHATGVEEGLRYWLKRLNDQND